MIPFKQVSGREIKHLDVVGQVAKPGLFVQNFETASTVGAPVTNAFATAATNEEINCVNMIYAGTSPVNRIGRRIRMLGLTCEICVTPNLKPTTNALGIYSTAPQSGHFIVVYDAQWNGSTTLAFGTIFNTQGGGNATSQLAPLTAGTTTCTKFLPMLKPNIDNKARFKILAHKKCTIQPVSTSTAVGANSSGTVTGADIVVDKAASLYKKFYVKLRGLS